jgi:HEPN domain-containing protein
MSDPADVSAWVRKAEHDLVAVDSISAGTDPPWDIVVFHAQQAAEKFLKALLVSRDHQPPKIHELTRLLALCVSYAPELAAFLDDCEFLSPLAVRSRYPGDEPDTAREDAEKGVQIARRIQAAVLERLQPEAP